MDIKKRIIKLQNERNWTVHRMAIQADLNTSTVSNWFSRNSTPTTEALERLCDAFGVTMSEFFNETDEIVSLTDEQKQLLSQWNRLYKDEKIDLLQFISTLNKNRE